MRAVPQELLNAYCYGIKDIDYGFATITQSPSQLITFAVGHVLTESQIEKFRLAKKPGRGSYVRVAVRLIDAVKQRVDLTLQTPTPQEAGSRLFFWRQDIRASNVVTLAMYSGKVRGGVMAAHLGCDEVSLISIDPGGFILLEVNNSGEVFIVPGAAGGIHVVA